MKKIMLIVVLAITGSALGLAVNLPIGPLVGSFIFILIAQLSGMGAKPLPRSFKVIAQVIIGGVAGLNINKAILDEIPQLLLPGFLSLMTHLLYSLGIAFVIEKLLHMDKITAFCGVIPAGMSEITFIAHDLKADVQMVIIMHLYRVMLIITLLPTLIKLMM